MTQILTAVCPFYIVQVSDRLITLGKTKFDAIAPKIVVCRPRDALVCVGYTGLAYLDGIPTDQWIAQRFWGDVLPAEAFLMLQRSRANRSDLGLIVKTLSADLVRALSRYPRQPLKINVAGWQWVREGIVRPISITLQKSAMSHEIHVSRTPRHWISPTTNFLLQDTGGWITPEDIAQMRFRLSEGDERDPGRTAQIMAETIRSIAARTPFVGTELITVSIPRPFGPVSIGFSSGDSLDRTHLYSPWIVGQTAILGAAKVTGGLTLNVDQIEISLIVPDRLGQGSEYGGKTRPADPSSRISSRY